MKKLNILLLTALVAYNYQAQASLGNILPSEIADQLAPVTSVAAPVIEQAGTVVGTAQGVLTPVIAQTGLEPVINPILAPVSTVANTVIETASTVATPVLDTVSTVTDIAAPVLAPVQGLLGGLGGLGLREEEQAAHDIIPQNQAATEEVRNAQEENIINVEDCKRIAFQVILDGSACSNEQKAAAFDYIKNEIPRVIDGLVQIAPNIAGNISLAGVEMIGDAVEAAASELPAAL